MEKLETSFFSKEAILYHNGLFYYCDTLSYDIVFRSNPTDLCNIINPKNPGSLISFKNNHNTTLLIYINTDSRSFLLNFVILDSIASNITNSPKLEGVLLLKGIFYPCDYCGLSRYIQNISWNFLYVK